METVVIPHYETFRKNRRRWGRLLQHYTYQTPILGYDVTYESPTMKAKLCTDGRLRIHTMSEWDFGSGFFTVQTIAMVYASLPHDVFCHMTNARLLPWECRKKADWYFGACLSAAGETFSRVWRTPGVMLYSQFVARWKDKTTYTRGV